MPEIIENVIEDNQQDGIIICQGSKAKVIIFSIKIIKNKINNNLNGIMAYSS